MKLPNCCSPPWIVDIYIITPTFPKVWVKVDDDAGDDLEMLIEPSDSKHSQGPTISH